jgi:NAD(P)-dependent dehydrogenase (short-subunit alcohol dehydrogenase family)
LATWRRIAHEAVRGDGAVHVSAILITGGGRGIGAATARLAAGRGHAVGVGYRERSETAELLVSEIRAAGGRACALGGDVSVEADVLSVFDRCESELGRMVGFVNNAGIVAPQSRLDAMSDERLKRVFAVNVLGAVLCAREAVRRMSTRHGGRGGAIVNVSSAASRLGSPGEYVDYAASKGALDSLTIGLAKEVAEEGVRVNSVRPGIIETEIHASGGDPGRVARLQEMVPMKRAGRAEEVARAILWLLSDDATYTTGAILDVSGGR